MPAREGDRDGRREVGALAEMGNTESMARGERGSLADPGWLLLVGIFMRRESVMVPKADRERVRYETPW